MTNIQYKLPALIITLMISMQTASLHGMETESELRKRWLSNNDQINLELDYSNKSAEFEIATKQEKENLANIERVRALISSRNRWNLAHGFSLSAMAILGVLGGCYDNLNYKSNDDYLELSALLLASQIVTSMVGLSQLCIVSRALNREKPEDGVNASIFMQLTQGLFGGFTFVDTIVSCLTGQLEKYPSFAVRTGLSTLVHGFHVYNWYKNQKACEELVSLNTLGQNKK